MLTGRKPTPQDSLSIGPNDLSFDGGSTLSHFASVIDNALKARKAMDEFLPDYLIREQAAVGALVIFGVLRIIVAAIAFERGWRISVVEKSFIAIAILYCVPQLFDLLMELYRARIAAAEFEGKAAGCAIALFCAPIVSHRLGYE